VIGGRERERADGQGEGSREAWRVVVGGARGRGDHWDDREMEVEQERERGRTEGSREGREGREDSERGEDPHE